jgi:hypothetical protein
MEPKKEVLFLLQVALPFVVLAFWKSEYFFIPVVVIFCSLPWPSLRKRLISAWQQLGIILGKIVSPIVLSAIYYLGLTPLAMVRRLFGGDELNLKRPATTNFKSVRRSLDATKFDDLW